MSEKIMGDFLPHTVDWNSWKIISRLTSLTFPFPAYPITDLGLLHREHPKFQPEQEWGKVVDFRHLSRRIYFSFDRSIFRMNIERSNKDKATGFTYRNLHGFARFPGDSRALVKIANGSLEVHSHVPLGLSSETL